MEKFMERAMGAIIGNHHFSIPRHTKSPRASPEALIFRVLGAPMPRVP